MVIVQLLYTERCPNCPPAKELFRNLKKNYEFEYEEIDAMSEKGRELAIKHNIRAVPTILIDDKIVFIGAPSKDKAIAAIKKK